MELLPPVSVAPPPTGQKKRFGERNGKHYGDDYPTPMGTPVVASAAGTVIRASLQTDAAGNTKGGVGRQFGNVVIIDHGVNECGNRVYTLYAHLSEMYVNAGHLVIAGQQIGRSGGAKGAQGAGNSSGPHLHFEVIISPEELPWNKTRNTGVLGSRYRVDPQNVINPPFPAPCILQTATPRPQLPIFSLSFPRRDPLILDLDGDGIEIVGPNAGVYFDHNGDGFSERTGWASSDDGILVWDRNGNGIIDDGTELFGDNTPLPDGSMASNGFQALSAYDDNNDGKIDVQDEIWANLQIWKDEDSNGFSSSPISDELHINELYSLNELGITAINLDSTITNTPDGQGNTQVRIGSFDKADGTTGTIGAYDLQRDTFDAVYGLLPVPDDIAALPDAEGSGNVYSLHQAMVRDISGELQALVETFVADTDATNRDATLRQILYKWTGADTVNPAAFSPNIDGRKVAVLEKLYGQTLDTPNANLAIQWKNLFRDIAEIYYGQLMAQSHLSDLYAQITYAFDFDKFQRTGDLSTVITQLQTELTNDPISGKERLSEFARSLRGLGLEDTVNYFAFRETFFDMDPELAKIIDIGGLSIIDGPGQGLFPLSQHVLGDDNAQAILRDPAIGNGWYQSIYPSYFFSRAIARKRDIGTDGV